MIWSVEIVDLAICLSEKSVGPFSVRTMSYLEIF